MKPSTEWWRYLAPLAVIAIIALLPLPAGLESHTWLYFAVFTGVIVGLILEPVPGAVVAMVGISIIAILSPWLLFSPEQLAQPGFKFTAKSLSGRFLVFLIQLSGLFSPPLCLVRAMKKPGLDVASR